MRKNLKFFFCLQALLFCGASWAQDVILCRISVENVPSHFHSRAVKRFAELTEKRAEGRLKVEFYDNARLFRDSDAINALNQGQVEIIVPGIWQLDRYVPDTAALMLPSFFARPRPIIRDLVDGPFGLVLSESIERSLNTVVLGPWLDLGYGHVFSLSGNIRTHEDLKGKIIRVAGGRGNEERIRLMGASPASIPWPDLPAYLSRRLVDCVLSTYETVDTARLDTQGIRAVLEDHQYYAFYIPLAANSFWAKLPLELKDIIRKTWLEVVKEAREESVITQNGAKDNLVNRGLRVYSPPEAQLNSLRERLLMEEEETARRLNISEAVYNLLKNLIAETGIR